jgi:SAM-dependent methyltransferase
MSVDPRVARQLEYESTFWSTDPFERPGVDSIENLLNKMQDAPIFWQILRDRGVTLRAGDRAAEVGGGQGWASCLLKRRHPEAHVVLTDGVREAVEGRVAWERVFGCTLDGAHAASAQQLPFADASLDLVFCFAAAHHFVDYTAALREMKRVLAADGTCLWLYEPSAPRWLQPLAEARVNRKRPDVPEHVIVPDEIRRLAREHDLLCSVEFSTSTVHRGPGATLYYLLLGALPLLQRWLPCTAHFTFRHAPRVHGSG